MREHFTRFDDALIDRVFQPLVDRVSAHLPVDCFRVARLCTDLSALAWILSQIGVITAAAGSGTAGYKSFQVALVVLGLGAITVLRTLFERAAGGTGNRMNPLRAGMSSHRLGCLLWLTALAVKTAGAPVGLASLALLAVGIFATAAVYAGACSNRPPRRHEQFGGNRHLRYAGARG